MTAAAIDTRDMVVVHDMLRRELGACPDLVRGVAPGDTARARVVADHVTLLLDLLHHHHATEDRLLWPKLLQRVPAEVAPVVELMQAQHEGIHEALDEAAGTLPRWRAGAAAADRDTLVDALERLHERLVEHLGAEEQRILPLVPQALEPDEWEQLGREGTAAVPRSRMPVVFGMIQKGADPAVVAGMIAGAPAPVRLIVPRIGPRAHARYARRVQGPPRPR